MNINLVTNSIDLNKVTKSETIPNVGYSYNFMHGDSPYFKSTRLLMQYYSVLSSRLRSNHIYTGEFRLLSIYSHAVALTDHTTPAGYPAKQGEVLSIDEMFIYDFNNKCWNDDDNFMKKKN